MDWIVVVIDDSATKYVPLAAAFISVFKKKKTFKKTVFHVKSVKHFPISCNY